LKLLLDTHVFIWLQREPERLGERIGLLEDLDNDLLVSAVLAWEIAIKHQLGRLQLPEPPQTYVPERVRAIKAESVPIEQAHALAVASLPALHRDPFDRLLIAQARSLGVPILTADQAIAAYPVETLMV
jgi:PIN domain nuclease of toxin-antitoxin system